MFTVLQWNCRGLRANWEELLLLLQKFQPSVVCLQETMVGPLSPHPPAGYKAFYSPHDPAQGYHGGSAIFISSSLTFTVLPLNSPLEVVAGRLHLQRTFTFYLLLLHSQENRRAWRVSQSGSATRPPASRGRSLSGFLRSRLDVEPTKTIRG